MNINTHIADYMSLRGVVTGAGHEWFTGHFNLNFVGVRNKGRRPGSFDDEFWFAYQVGETYRAHVYPGTTDPGPGLGQNVNKAGMARMVAGQHRRAYILGRHKGRPALKQNPDHPTPYQRCPIGMLDDYRQGEFDWSAQEVHSDHIGLNHHDSGVLIDIDKRVSDWSHGCQVAVFQDDIALARHLLQQQAVNGHGTSLTYTLVER